MTIFTIGGEFNNASARRALVDWYLSLFIMCEAWHQYNERPRALALLNSPLVRSDYNLAFLNLSEWCCAAPIKFFFSNLKRNANMILGPLVFSRQDLDPFPEKNRQSVYPH